jgi:hypothetical protein
MNIKLFIILAFLSLASLGQETPEQVLKDLNAKELAASDDGQFHDSEWYDRKRHEARGEPMPRKKKWPGVTGSYTEYKPDKQVQGNWQGPTSYVLIVFVVFMVFSSMFIWFLQKSKSN